jgi:branched-chain amino acid transport system substrate-binding protein
LAYGGADPATPGMDEYAKAHKALLNRDYEAGGVQVYAALQFTQQAIEQVGEIDRKKIRDVMGSSTFKTIWGDMRFVKQLNANPWSVSQWQNGELVAVAPANKPGAKPLQFPKPAWS